MPFLSKARNRPPVQLTQREREVVNSFLDAVRALGQQLDLSAVQAMIRNGVPGTLNVSDFISQLGGFVDAVRGEVGASGLSAIRESLPTGYKSVVGFDRLDPRAVAWAEERAGVLIAQISDEQREMLRRTIAQGITDQVTAEELGMRIRSQIGLHSQWGQAVERATSKELKRLMANGLSMEKALERAEKFRQRYHDKLLRTRARNIARTEIMTAQNQGRLLGWLEMANQGILAPNALKTWKVGPSGWKGKVVCDVCAPLDGQSVKVTESFSNGVAMPPAHPNCRCTAVIKPIPIEEVRQLISYDDSDYEAADTILSGARENEPGITRLMTRLASESGGRMEGLEHRLKGRVSLARKIHGDVIEKGVSSMDAARQINDSVRYTMMLPHGDYTDGIMFVRRTLESEGFVIRNVKNFWVPGNDYKGVHFIVADPKGVLFELQFHTDESMRVKNIVHGIYEKWRVMPDGPDKTKLFEEMVGISNEQPTPAKIDLIGSLVDRVKKAAEWVRKWFGEQR
jgi:hypothetical protein